MSLKTILMHIFSLLYKAKTKRNIIQTTSVSPSLTIDWRSNSDLYFRCCCGVVIVYDDVAENIEFCR